MTATEWAFDRIEEAFELVAQDEARKVSIVQEICSEAWTTCGASSHQLEDKEESQCPACVQDWQQPNRLLAVQRGDSIEQAKVVKAHAVSQGLCANLINAWKLLATSKKVKNLGEVGRRGLTDGLRDFIKVDNERALDVGALRLSTGTFQVRKPKTPVEGSDVIVRESRVS